MQLASFVYESSLQQNPREFHNYFSNISEIHSHATRQPSDQEFFIQRKNAIQYDLFSVRYAGASFWNSIPKDIRSRPSLHSFRKTLKNILIAFINTFNNCQLFLSSICRVSQRGVESFQGDGAWQGVGWVDGLLGRNLA